MSAADERPFPPGDYPVVVVGSGPGAIQLSYELERLGIDHATISADEAPGGMFRRWPFFQRLLSWTKPYAPEERTTRAFERWDWNSMIAERPEHRALQAEYMDGTSDFPSRPEMEQSLTAFTERTGTRIRYGCRWTATRREPGPDGDRFVVETTDGEYRCRIAIVAVGVAEPWSPSTPGIELTAHYADTRSAETYAGKRVFIIGKQNSGFELASGLLQWAARITLASPSPARLSVVVNSLNGVRARYVQPFEDSALGFGVDILNASIERITRSGNAFHVDLRQTVDGSALMLEADEVISATGFTCPLLDLPELGVATFGQAKLPAQTAFWESATVPGIYFAGTITQGAAGLKKHGMPAFSGAVQGHRYNARILARHLGERHFGMDRDRPAIRPRDLLDYLLDEATGGPELWHQKGYLARVVSLGSDGPRDEGILPLTHALDDGDGDSLILTVEADGAGAIYPVLYVRHDGRTEEHALDSHPLLDFRTTAHRRQLADMLKRVVPGVA
ncbi:MAG: NAD(P)-binding domain-containing protein [Chloroflexota bacterium]